MAQQPGFFDVDGRPQELSAKGDAPDRLAVSGGRAYCLGIAEGLKPVADATPARANGPASHYMNLRSRWETFDGPRSTQGGQILLP